MPFKDRYALFCKRTTLHGFSEFYESASKWQKVFWFLVILASATMLVLFILIQTGQYLNGPAGTRITRLATSDPPYQFPRVMVFDSQWSWIDISKLERYNMSREEIQMAMSYMAPGMVRNGSVPIGEVKEMLRKKMHEFNVSTVLQFYRLISLDVFDGTVKEDFIYDRGFSSNETYYCLNTSDTDKAQFAKAWIFAFEFDYPTYWKNAKALFSYLDWINKTEEEITGHRARLFNIDTYMYVAIEPGFLHHINTDNSIFRPLGTCTKEHSVQALYFMDSCRLDCAVKVNISMDAFSCYWHNRSDRTAIELTESFRHGRLKVCHPGIRNLETGELEGVEKPIFRELSDSETEKRHREVGACQDRCLRKCEQWITTWSISSYREISRSDVSRVLFIFPDPKVLVVVEEIQTYQWHDLVSDFGGLLGLWLGASMMSVVQMIHLCLFPREKRFTVPGESEKQ